MQRGNEQKNEVSNYPGKKTIDHKDPINHRLICGLKNNLNETEVSYSYNSRKTNHFVPYRVCGFPAPNYFGDIGEFLINNQWIVCEFGGKTWWDESNRVGNGHTAPASEKQKAVARATGARNVRDGIVSKAGKVGSAQRWQCTETGFVSNAGNLAKYHRARGIDTNCRVRIK